ncbi:hypothetical protein KC367_g3675 [Hortaea werneckii]|nr:hypothetical protein KC342_g3348 [Hortaea werneckii]KAI7333100.1 hypothetical protein KC340_g3081 [Hortaea werneckii]KAI7394021.1 hypothetical protein KC328_g6326 [Hortaea werneckii]KAI7482269.1 hypothetical protein KC357_g3612 [Hortaea werneckii]KAI7500401.1 hypothetical protein KC367_g3675 [Hortaea werneckii]
MLSLPQRLTASGRFSAPNTPHLGRFLSSKPARVTCAVVVAFGLLLLSGSLYAGHGNRSSAAAAAANTVVDALQEEKTALSSSAQKGRFHLLIPATSSNQDLCKLMLSAQVLGYPTPVFINFGHPEAEDAYIQHLAKVEGILDYLDRLENDPEYKEELVLIVDGYDLWFQLRPEVLLKRYYALNEEADKRLRVTYGDTVARAHDMRQTILFGPDKICWPINFARTACWAVSGTTLRDDAFGPGTSNGRPELAYPRWLNSGTIMGPASDLKTMFRRTLEMIHENHIVDSDQYYLAEVYGKQEYARLLQNKGELNRYTSVRYGYMEANASKPEEANIPTWIEPDMPEIGENETVEYHIGIDFESGLFQTLAFWKQYLTWMRPSESWVPGRDLQPPAGSQSYYQLWLPGDVSSSMQPFATVSAEQAGDAGLDITRTWHDVDLLYNPITKQVPVIIHFTGEKQFRDIWWKKIWFQEHASLLRESALNHQYLRQQEPMMEVIGGYRWYNAEPPEAEDVKMRGLGGAWSDDGGWFSWRSLCHVHEEGIYRVPNDDDFHAPPMSAEGEDDTGSS